MYSKLNRYKQVLVLLFLALLPLAGNSLTQQSVNESHDLIKQEDDSYIVSGNDAYVVLPIENASDLGDLHSDQQIIDGIHEKIAGQWLSFELSFAEMPEGLNSAKQILENTTEMVSVELFFNPSFRNSPTGENQSKFDAFKRLKFSIPKVSDQRVTLKLPEDLSIDRTLVRIDIDQCPKCRINVGSHVSLSNLNPNSLAQSGTVVEQFELFRGLQKIPKQGLSLDLDNWLLNDLNKFEDAHFETTGNDPFLVSPMLDNDLSELGGVYFDIDIPNTKLNVVDLQLFYATEHHGFIEAASSFIRLAPNGNRLKQQSTTSGNRRFFVPLKFLAKQARPTMLLKRLRLDLATISDNSYSTHESYTPKWRVNEVKLVNSAQTEMFEALTPNQLLHTIRQSNSRRLLVLNIFKKISSDIWFTVLYLILLIGAAVTIVIKLRRA